jgi:glycosyltransferase involved in cell wall biosynthesis
MRNLVVVHVLTTPLSLRLLKGQAAFLAKSGCTIHVVTSPGELLQKYGEQEPATVHAVPMNRGLSPLADVIAVIRLYRLIRRVAPDIVQAGTPKAGLLGTVAAWVARVPTRVYHVRGLPHLTQSPLAARLLRVTERVTCACATHVLAVSSSIATILVDEHLCAGPKMHVLMSGSSNGVDADGMFNPSKLATDARESSRRRLGVPSDARMIGFVGRLVRDKGVVELERAWGNLRNDFPDAHLLIVGPKERRNRVPPDVYKNLASDPRVRLVGLEWNTPPLYAAMDIFCLPSHREGFPNVVLEASSMGLPIVATEIPGCVDAIDHGRTGILVPPGDSASLERALAVYLKDKTLRQAHGAAARERASTLFRQEAVWNATHTFYRAAVQNSGGVEALGSKAPAISGDPSC